MELRNQNKSVLADFNIQIDAREKFTSALKSVSQTIDKAARLRGEIDHQLRALDVMEI